MEPLQEGARPARGQIRIGEEDRTKTVLYLGLGMCGIMCEELDRCFQ